MDVEKRKFGVLSDGSKVHLYTVSNDEMSFTVTNYGAVITSVLVPSRSGKLDDVVLVPPTFDSLVRSNGSFGAPVGRFANRIGGARFSLNGENYVLDKNDNGNCLHGGFFRWDKQLWNAKVVDTAAGTGVQFCRESPDGEQGMPGNMKIKVTYLLNSNNELNIHYDAVSDKDTPINLTNHSYFNLNGQLGGTVDTHHLELRCSSYLELDKYLVPTGRVLPVEGTVFDFRVPKEIGTDLNTADFGSAGGYDHCYCIDRKKEKLVVCAVVRANKSGRVMTVSTDMPAVQFYTGNGLGGVPGKNGAVFHRHDAFCLETQFYPDSPNKPNFPDCILRAGERFSSTTVYGFAW